MAVTVEVEVSGFKLQAPSLVSASSVLIRTRKQLQFLAKIFPVCHKQGAFYV